MALGDKSANWLPSIAAKKLSWVLKSASPSEEELFYHCVRDAGGLLFSCLCLNAPKCMTDSHLFL